MKSVNLKKLKENGFNVPKFIVTNKEIDTELLFSDADLFAVRSSYEKEDGEKYSYAGQFKTILNVPRSGVNKAILEVLESKSIQYNEINNIEGNGKMNVIIQEMVEEEIAGVMFTSNPQGLLNELVIVVGRGIGEGIVNGTANTTTYYIVGNEKYYEMQDSSPILQEELVDELYEIGKQIEKLYNTEMDIEFCIKDGEIYILQARPITTLNKEEIHILDNSNIVESYPNISLPLTQDFAKAIYYRVFDSVVKLIIGERTAKEIDGMLREMVAVCNGNIYYSIDSWYTLLTCLPFSNKIIPIWQEMLGIEVKDIFTKEKYKQSMFVKFKVLISFPWILLNTPKKMKKLEVYFDKKLVDYNKQLEDVYSISELLSLYNSFMTELGGEWGITLINDLYAFIFTKLAEKKHNIEIGNIEEIESLKPVKMLQLVVYNFNKYGINSNEYKKSAEEYIELYGDRALEELKLESKTFRTNPELFDDFIKTREEKEIIKSESNIKQSFFLKRAKIGIRNRESSRLNRCRIFGVARKIFYKIADILLEENRIEKRDDIFWLYIEELESDVDFKEIISKRKEVYKGFELLPTYNRLIFSGDIYNKYNFIQKEIDYSQSLLRGIPCSKGYAEGVALVIDKPRLDLDTRGKILITKTTDPAWVFLVENAMAIVAEKGSLLSHTAIITRELGKPSVVGVKDATQLIKTGDYIKVDGINGTIEIER